LPSVTKNPTGELRPDPSIRQRRDLPSRTLAGRRRDQLTKAPDYGAVLVAIPVAQFYLSGMLQRTLPAGFIAPCLPTTDKLPSGRQWLHEIKHTMASGSPAQLFTGSLWPCGEARQC